ncbi:hypothetical protein [Phenylobacterium sp.]|uniref:hypothetical protein n=1 Tax=Phenylobacterium sp. TaxID=1871053 RepID=UPI00374CF7A8
MPVYQFYPLPSRDEIRIKVVLFSDAAAGRTALGAQFPQGCDVWQSTRYVGRFHRRAERSSDTEGS